MWRHIAVETLKTEIKRLEATGDYQDRVRAESHARSVSFLVEDGKRKQAEGRAKAKRPGAKAIADGLGLKGFKKVTAKR